MSSGGGALAKIDPAAGDLREQLSSKNLNPLYNRDEMLSLGRDCSGVRALTGASTPARACGSC